MRSVTAKPPKMLMLAITTAARPSHLDTGDPAAALAISAPTMMTDEIALVTLISGVCSAGVTDQTTKEPTKQARTKSEKMAIKYQGSSPDDTVRPSISAPREAVAPLTAQTMHH